MDKKWSIETIAIQGGYEPEVTEPRILPRSHFDKAECVAVLGNDVYLGKPLPHVPFENAKSARLELFADEVFAPDSSVGGRVFGALHL